VFEDNWIFIFLVILFGHKTSPYYWSDTAAAEVQVTIMRVGFELDRLQTKDRKEVMYYGALHGTHIKWTSTYGDC
jgi:hypothetical protein